MPGSNDSASSKSSNRSSSDKLAQSKKDQTAEWQGQNSYYIAQERLGGGGFAHVFKADKKDSSGAHRALKLFNHSYLYFRVKEFNEETVEHLKTHYPFTNALVLDESTLKVHHILNGSEANKRFPASETPTKKQLALPKERNPLPNTLPDHEPTLASPKQKKLYTAFQNWRGRIAESTSSSLAPSTEIKREAQNLARRYLGTQTIISADRKVNNQAITKDPKLHGLSMKYFEGEDCTRFIPESDTENPNYDFFKMGLFLHLAHALYLEHGRGGIHTDLKPQNMLASTHKTGAIRGATKQAQFCDWGSARQIGIDDKSGGSQHVTESYRDPQAEGKPPIQAHDIYAFAISLAEMSNLARKTQCKNNKGELLYIDSNRNTTTNPKNSAGKDHKQKYRLTICSADEVNNAKPKVKKLHAFLARMTSPNLNNRPDAREILKFFKQDYKTETGTEDKQLLHKIDRSLKLGFKNNPDKKTELAKKFKKCADPFSAIKKAQAVPALWQDFHIGNQATKALNRFLKETIINLESKQTEYEIKIEGIDEMLKRVSLSDIKKTELSDEKQILENHLETVKKALGQKQAPVNENLDNPDNYRALHRKISQTHPNDRTCEFVNNIKADFKRITENQLIKQDNNGPHRAPKAPGLKKYAVGLLVKFEVFCHTVFVALSKQATFANMPGTIARYLLRPSLEKLADKTKGDKRLKAIEHQIEKLEKTMPTLRAR